MSLTRRWQISPDTFLKISLDYFGRIGRLQFFIIIINYVALFFLRLSPHFTLFVQSNCTAKTSV